MEKLTSKAAVLDYFKNKIATNDNWAKRALIVVYDNQTALEKSSEHTIIQNNVGFGKCDAKKLSYYGSLAKNPKVKLYPEVMAYLKKKMPHYANQLVDQCIKTGSIKKVNGEYIWDNRRD